MSTADDGEARRGLTGWFGRMRGSQAADTIATAAPATADRLLPESELLDAVVSGLPDPVVVLDRDGRVISFNASAGALAPALRRGELASIALRTPELNEAIRAAGATGRPQRIEFSARLPAARWSEAFVAPVPLGGPANMIVVTVH